MAESQTLLVIRNLVNFWKNQNEVPTFCPSSIGLVDRCNFSKCKDCKEMALREAGLEKIIAKA